MLCVFYHNKKKKKKSASHSSNQRKGNKITTCQISKDLKMLVRVP